MTQGEGHLTSQKYLIFVFQKTTCRLNGKTQTFNTLTKTCKMAP